MVRRLFTVAIIFFVAPTTSMATQHGAKIGLNYSFIVGDVNYDKGKLGYNIGLIEYFRITDRINIQAEILYCTKGAIFTQVGIDIIGNELGTFDVVYHYGYLEIPALAKYSIAINGTNDLGLFIGPHISFLANAYWRITEPAQLGIEDKKYDISDRTNNIDYGLIGGLDYQFSVSKVKLFIDVRYCVSLNSVSKSVDWNWAHHQLFSSALGIKF